METEENIFMVQFNKYKNYIFSFLYLCLFLFTLFISFLIIFQQLHKNNINFIYFYLTFCVGLFFLLGLLIFQQDLLSFILFFTFFLYSFFFLFLILRFDYSIYLKNTPIFTAILIMLSILFIVLLILIGEVCLQNNTLSYFAGINLFSLLFIFYYFYNSLNSKKIFILETVPTISTEDSYSYVSFYKLYVFVMCTFYFFIYIQNLIQNQYSSILFLFIILGLILYIIRINGKALISLQVFLLMEYIPLLIVFLGGLNSFYKEIFNGSSITDSIRKSWILTFCISVVSFCTSCFVYYYSSNPRFITTSQFSLWNFISIFLILISVLGVKQYTLLALITIFLMIFLLGALLYFLKFISFSIFNTYYVILFLIIIIGGIIGFINKNQINPELVYGNQLLKISYSSIFKTILAIIILLTLLSFANISNQTVERFFIMLILCGLPAILFYLFYTSNKKATNTNFFVSCIRMMGDILSTFLKNMGKIIILLFVILLSTICLFNVLVNKFSTIDVYFLAYFFFLILYIIYYFSDFLKGQFESEKMVKQISMINLLLFFSAIIIYYLIYGLGYISKGAGNVSKQSLYSQTIFYLILFVFLAFVYVYYRNNLSDSTNPYINLCINIILYIPCLFVNVIEYIQSQMKEKSSPYFIILLIEIFLVLFYGISIYLQTKHTTQGGTNIIREPLNLNIDTPLLIPDAYQTQPSKPFALSFWFYINSQSLNTNKYYNILNYQFRPQILYNPKLNTLLIDVSGNNWETSYLNTYNVKNTSLLPENSVDTSGNETILDPELQTTGIIYVNNKIPLQKWNHLVVNYSGSIMDIFLNGKLVKSSSQVVPNVQSLLFDIGQADGINGGVCNLMFYNHVLTYSSVLTLYQSVKDINPPVPTIYWDSQKKRIQSSKFNNLKEQYKLNKILNI
jgi:hypothetical protein